MKVGRSVQNAHFDPPLSNPIKEELIRACKLDKQNSEDQVFKLVL